MWSSSSSSTIKTGQVCLENKFTAYLTLVDTKLFKVSKCNIYLYDFEFEIR